MTKIAIDTARDDAGLASVDLVLSLLEHLSARQRPCRLTEIARELDLSKARTHRHLRALMARGYVRQDSETGRYEVTTRLMALGDAVRGRFDVLTVMRPEMARLRDATSQTVTASAFIDDQVIVLDILYGRTVIEFGVRPGTSLDLHSSAHGLLALAFGPDDLLQRVLLQPRKAWTSATITDADELVATVEQVRRQGWATAPDQVVMGVNALAAPVCDHSGTWRGNLALVGPTQFITTPPSHDQVREVLAAASAASRNSGWKAEAA